MIRFLCSYIWLSVIDKKVAHPNEIQNTLVRRYEGTKVLYEGTVRRYLRTFGTVPSKVPSYLEGNFLAITFISHLLHG